MSDRLQLSTTRIDTPIGEMVIVADAQGCIRAADWTDHEDRLQRLLRNQYGKGGFRLAPGRNLDAITSAIRRYFAGEFEAIDFLTVQTAGTPFQRAVWRALRAIPAGTTESYGRLAQRIGRPAAVRAVGLANGANAVGIVVPCHRVIGSDGSLTGYGGGLDRKRWLLEHEKRRRA
jgi:methylated-DNA-[protein]-cysteine S-methyltransferase